MRDELRAKRASAQADNLRHLENKTDPVWIRQQEELKQQRALAEAKEMAHQAEIERLQVRNREDTRVFEVLTSQQSVSFSS